jgi:haloacetate dehalogenase
VLAGLGAASAGATARNAIAAGESASAESYFPGFTTETVETSGTTIHVLHKGAGRPLLLLRRYPETHLTWHKIAPQLAEHFTVVVPDLRGYGQSGRPPDGDRHQNYAFRAMAQDQVDVMRSAVAHFRWLPATFTRSQRLQCSLTPPRISAATLMQVHPVPRDSLKLRNSPFPVRTGWTTY